MNLSKISRRISSCTDCPLHENATRSVPGEGDPNADVIFVGEGPGKEEDEKGRPFVGRGGEKLNDLLRSQSIARDQVYITNTVKHRPPENRNPKNDEIEACSGYLREEIGRIDPLVIVPLGNTATRELLDTKEGITSLRGKFYPWQGNIKLFPMYHPSYLLRNLPGKGDKSPEEQSLEDISRLKEEAF